MARCFSCGKEYTAGRNCYGKYCSNACQAKLRTKAVVDKWLMEQTPETFYNSTKQVKRAIRKYLIELNNHKCCLCGWNKRHPLDNLSTLEVDHINGDWNDCSTSNIRVICPNCHSLTLNYKGRNKGNGRGYRRS